MIEVIAVLIIIAILAPLIVTRVSTDTTSLTAQADILKSHLRYAQIRAMNDTVTWGISLGGTAYTLVQTGGPATYLPGDSGATHALTDNVTVSGSSVLFNEWGIPVDGSGTPLGTATITLSQGSQSSAITVTGNTGFVP